jgi:hypothetical protein
MGNGYCRHVIVSTDLFDADDAQKMHRTKGRSLHDLPALSSGCVAY